MLYINADMHTYYDVYMIVHDLFYTYTIQTNVSVQGRETGEGTIAHDGGELTELLPSDLVICGKSHSKWPLLPAVHTYPIAKVHAIILRIIARLPSRSKCLYSFDVWISGVSVFLNSRMHHLLLISGSSLPLYPYHVLDEEFPGICFLGEPQEVAVQSEPVTHSPPGLGVTLKIPPNAVQSSDEPVNVSLRTCLPSTVFQYPKDCTPLSAVYHISSNRHFNEVVELTIEHFADLKTDKQANEMTFFRAESEEKGKYSFTPMEGGVFKVGGHRCTISTRLVPSFVSAGSIPSSEIGKHVYS